MSESLQSSGAESRARWLADLDPNLVHAWMVRALSRQQHDLLSSAFAGPPARGPIHEAREAFIDWCAAGAELFLREGAGLPSRRNIDDTSHRVMLAVVLRRHRSITAAAQALETSRRALRDTMKRLGLYQAWQKWQARDGAIGSKVEEPKWPVAEEQAWPAQAETPRTTPPLDEPPAVP